MAVTTSVTWNDPTSAKINLAPLLDAYGGCTVLVRIDPTNPHARGMAPYRSARFAPDSAGGADHWYDADTGLELHTAVTGWAVP